MLNTNVFEKQQYDLEDIKAAVKFGLNYGLEEEINISEDDIIEWLSDYKKRSAEDWQKLEPEIKVITNKGWTKRSWYEEQLTYNEYVERRNKNTCYENTPHL